MSLPARMDATRGTVTESECTGLHHEVRSKLREARDARRPPAAVPLSIGSW
ncbi:hypothetical protein [Streptomyces caelestis]|uniref:hypothetical protein n=1 Tax=Streptomyces caelestis TaxID=36816 RepID=UPI00365F9D5E